MRALQHPVPSQGHFTTVRFLTQAKAIANGRRHYQQSCVKNLHQRNDRIVRRVQYPPSSRYDAVKREDV
jgi:hypothetical protein